MTASVPPRAAASIGASVVWAAPRYPEFVFHHWESASFVFDPASGRTHYLNEAAAEILEKVAEEPRSTAALLEAMIAEHPIDDPDAFRDAGRRLLTLLDQLGLILEVH